MSRERLRSHPPAFCVLALQVLIAPAGCDAAEVRIAASEGVIEPSTARLSFEAVTGSPSDAEIAGPGDVEVTLPGTVSLELASGVSWRMSFVSDDYWSPDEIFTPQGEQHVLALRLVPKGLVTGRLELVDRDAEVPPALKADFRSPPGVGPINVDDTVLCPVDDRVWQCRLPALELDLKLRAPGFISHYFWERPISSDTPLEVGVLILRRGSSLVGWVETEDGLPAAQGCIVSLAPSATGQVASSSEEREKAFRESVETNERGFFHFEGIAPGSYVAAARKAGFVAASSAAIPVVEGAETVLQEPLLLGKPLEIEVVLEPATDPEGKPWRLALLRGEPPELVLEARADEEGQLRRSGLAAGRYRLQVADSRGSRIAAEEIFLEPGRTSFAFELPLIWVEGSLALGDEPLPGELSFGGAFGEVSVAMTADEEGLFTGWLPRPGKWDVDVRSRGPSVFRRLRKVEVDKVPGLSLARVDIVLPGTTLEGEVVDEDGRSVSPATVLAMPFPAIEKVAFTQVDEDGNFQFRGFEPGTFRLEARAPMPGGTATSEPLEIDIPDEESEVSVRLVARAMTKIEGSLRSPLGAGIPGALILARPVVTAGVGGLLVPQARSGIDGRFSLEIPSRAGEVELTVQAPGLLFYRDRVTPDPAARLDVVLPQNGGGALSLQLVREVDPWSTAARPYLIQDGRFKIDLGTLQGWASLNGEQSEGGALVVPLMPPGSYSWCVSHRESAADRCENGFLTPSGTLTLVLPGSDEEAGAGEEETPPEQGGVAH